MTCVLYSTTSFVAFLVGAVLGAQAASKARAPVDTGAGCKDCSIERSVPFYSNVRTLKVARFHTRALTHGACMRTQPGTRLHRHACMHAYQSDARATRQRNGFLAIIQCQLQFFRRMTCVLYSTTLCVAFLVGAVLGAQAASKARAPVDTGAGCKASSKERLVPFYNKMCILKVAR